MKYIYCYKCGQKTEEIMLEGRKREYCPNCQAVLYDNPIPSVAICTENLKGEILLVKRSVEPEKGKWCLPGGFIERGETSEQTVFRELKEETGLEAHSPQIIDVETHLNGYFGDILLIGYRVILKNYEPTPGDDAEEAEFYDYSEMPAVAFKAHRKFVKLYRNQKKD